VANNACMAENLPRRPANGEQNFSRAQSGESELFGVRASPRSPNLSFEFPTR
jgi:hypothetical protein